MQLLKQLETESQNLTWAIQRHNELLQKSGQSSPQMIDMILQFGVKVCNELAALQTQPRIAPEQVEADQTLNSALDTAIKGWTEELELLRKEQVDQAIIDGKAGEKSSRYIALEKREHDLTTFIIDAETKLGRVSNRIASHNFADAIARVVSSSVPLHSAFDFGNGKRIIIYTQAGIIKTNLYDENWQFVKLYASSPLINKSDVEYHRWLRTENEKAFVKDRSSEL